MKPHILMLCTIAMLGLSGCSAGPHENALIEVNCEDFSGESTVLTRQVDVTVGDTIELWICSNPSTGFEWEEASISEPSILIQTFHEFLPPEDAKPGGAGQEHWTFEAQKSGDCSVSFTYSRPWEGGEKGVWKLSLNVTVS
ncbi:MAG: protease inhibitor I42 family protein [Dehalococcoidia bacterium]|nr:protease inhibitor I42 family protein [Dehalococcoidia bacterium]